MRKNSFLEGAASVLEIFPTEKDRHLHFPILSDDEAMKNDLEQVGNDMFFSHINGILSPSHWLTSHDD